MRFLEGALLWLGVSGFFFNFLFHLSAIVFKKDKLHKVAHYLFVFGFVFLTFSIAVRWVESGHPPVLWTYEHALSGAWVIAGVFSLVVAFNPTVRPLGVIITPIILLTLGHGVMSDYTGTEPLPPPYQHGWLWVHVGFAWVAYGAYYVSAGSAILYLLKEKSINKNGEENIHNFFKKIPQLKELDILTFRLIIYGFIAHIIMLGAGALWAYGLWSRYWAWDPIEIWTLISWLIYGLNIHLRATYKWKDKKAAWLAIISLIGVMIFFGGIGFIGGTHTPLL